MKKHVKSWALLLAALLLPAPLPVAAASAAPAAAWEALERAAGQTGALEPGAHDALGHRLLGARRAEVAVAAIRPGKDISPKISDPGRVRAILELVAAVYAGRPLPFPKDGTVFQNREGLLPSKPSGYYREYTFLPPPGSPSTVTVGGRTFSIDPPQGRRGAERLIIGGGEVLYYSPDHYKTFIQLEVLP